MIFFFTLPEYFFRQLVELMPNIHSPFSSGLVFAKDRYDWYHRMRTQMLDWRQNQVSKNQGLYLKPKRFGTQVDRQTNETIRSRLRWGQKLVKHTRDQKHKGKAETLTTSNEDSLAHRWKIVSDTQVTVCSTLFNNKVSQPNKLESWKLVHGISLRIFLIWIISHLVIWSYYVCVVKASFGWQGLLLYLLTDTGVKWVQKKRLLKTKPKALFSYAPIWSSSFLLHCCVLLSLTSAAQLGLLSSWLLCLFARFVWHHVFNKQALWCLIERFVFHVCLL